MEVIVDRIEGEFIVVEIEKGKTGYISLSLLPLAKEGDVINISIDKDKRFEKEEEIKKLMDQVFED